MSTYISYSANVFIIMIALRARNIVSVGAILEYVFSMILVRVELRIFFKIVFLKKIVAMGMIEM